MTFIRLKSASAKIRLQRTQTRPERAQTRLRCLFCRLQHTLKAKRINRYFAAGRDKNVGTRSGESPLTLLEKRRNCIKRNAQGTGQEMEKWEHGWYELRIKQKI